MRVINKTSRQPHTTWRAFSQLQQARMKLFSGEHGRIIRARVFHDSEMLTLAKIEQVGEIKFAVTFLCA